MIYKRSEDKMENRKATCGFLSIALAIQSLYF